MLHLRVHLRGALPTLGFGPCSRPSWTRPTRSARPICSRGSPPPPATSRLQNIWRGRVGRDIAARVAAFESADLARRCVERAAEARWLELESACRERESRARMSESRRHVRRALDLGEKGDYRSSVAELARAHRAHPLDEQLLLLMMRTALRIGLDEEVQLGREALLQRGLPAQGVEERIARLRRLNEAEAEPGRIAPR
jgi:hypothetical protein